MILNILFLLLSIVNNINCNQVSYYPKIGESFTLKCNNQNKGDFFCYSTYTFKNKLHSMVKLNDTDKYEISKGSLTIKNFKISDAGYYACSNNCEKMKSDFIEFYLEATGFLIFSILSNTHASTKNVVLAMVLTHNCARFRACRALISCDV